MKAISTIYKGGRFRSRLEARWAIFFDSIDIGWEYETEGFELDKTKYLTDFKLLAFGANEVDLFVEIKPRRPNYEEIKKCYEVSVGTNSDVLLICGTPGLPEFSALGENWNLKTGYVALHFPAKSLIGGKEKNTPFEIWKESCRFELFQTGPDGYSLDVWPIYWSVEDIDEETRYYGIIAKVNSNLSDIYGVTAFGSIMTSRYLSSKPDGRWLDHERLIYGYEIATCARFEHDEFNLTIIDGFYRELELIPFKNVYSDSQNSYALYYELKTKRFISKQSNEDKPEGTITLVKKAPKLLIKQFVTNYPLKNRSDTEEQILKIWQSFLFRYRIQLKDLKLKRKTK
jgi:hypothetical protein